MTTLYFAGGEDTSFTNIGGIWSLSTSSEYFRNGFARAAFESYGANYTTSTPAAYLASPQFGPLSSFWVHARCFVDSSATVSNAIHMALLDSSGYMRIAVRGTGTNGQLKISTCNTSGTFTDLVTSASNTFTANTSGEPMTLDLFCDYSTTGQCTLYLNGVNIADTGASVNVTTNSVTQLSQLYLMSCMSFTHAAWSECIIQDTSTLGMALVTIPPLASGNTQSWSGAVGDVDEAVINDANFIYTASDNELSEWTVSTSLPSGSWTIAAVVQEARVSAGSTGPQHFEWLVRTTDGTDHVTGSVSPPVGVPGNSSNIWTQNPHTGDAWNAGELINAGIESLA